MGWIQSNSPGKVWKNILILGSAPGEAFITPPGDIRAYDVVTGKKVWQFHTVPQPGEFGYDTWPKDAYKYVGGANNWGSMSVDDERGIVYVPTGSATYDFYGADRIGQNLFANCLLALDARTGKRLWHFQTVHHDLWDFDNVSAPQLVTVRHNGQRSTRSPTPARPASSTSSTASPASRCGRLKSGRCRRATCPASRRGRRSRSRPSPRRSRGRRSRLDDVNPWLLTPEQYTAMQERVAKARNGRASFTPPGAGRDTISMPGNQGGSNWGTTAAQSAEGAGVRRQRESGRDPQARGREDPHACAGGGGGGTRLQAGFAAYQQHCSVATAPTCRVRSRACRRSSASRDRMGEDAIKAIVTGGRGLMRPVPSDHGSPS